MTAVASPAGARVRAKGRHSQRARTRMAPGDIASFLVMVAVVWLVWPASLGGRLGLVIIAGESMTPTYLLGDLAITWRTTPEIGDVILYRVPEGPGEGQPVIHRIVGGNPAAWVTQGDNSAKQDRWTPAAEDVLGSVWISIPSAGRAIWFLRSPLAIAALAGFAVTLWMWPTDDLSRGRHLATRIPALNG